MSARRKDIDDCDVQYMNEVESMSLQAIADYYGVCQMTIYYRLHPDKLKEHNKQRYRDRSEEIKEYEKQWRLENPEYYKQWCLEHPERNKQWRLDNPEYTNTWRRDTEKGRACVIRQRAERRGLGSIELNEPFPNSEGHHIDETYIIHIPKELHHSIPHNVRTGEGMEDINEIAFQYIDEETFDKLIAGEI